jgi:hypothetical protein
LRRRRKHRRLPQGIHPPTASPVLVFDDYLDFESGCGFSPTTYGENLLCLLAGSQAGSNIINAYLHPLPSSPRLARRPAYLGAARGHARMPPPASSRNISSPLSILSLPPLFLCTHRTRERWRKHALRCFVIPAPFPPTPQQQTRLPTFTQNLRNQSLSGFFNISALPVGGLACSATHYPPILIDKGEN